MTEEEYKARGMLLGWLYVVGKHYYMRPGHYYSSDRSQMLRYDADTLELLTREEFMSREVKRDHT